jgi:periplasmic protein CpxP/Spy
MFKKCLFALLFAGLVYTVSPAVAQESGSSDQQPAPPHGYGRGHMDPAKRTAMLTKQLNLNADQQAKVQDIFKSEQSQMESLRSDSSLSEDDRRAKMMDIHKATNDQVRALLDPDQQKKFDEMQSMRRERMQGHQQGGDAPPPPPPQ